MPSAVNRLFFASSARSAVLAVCLVLLTGFSLQAQSLKDPLVEGVLFYREHPYADDPLTAWPIEYCSAAGNGKIVIVNTKQGKRLRLLDDQVAATVPYPGRSGLTREQGLQLCDDALSRFPSQTQLLLNIRQAWAAVTPQDYVTHAAVSANRQSQVDIIIQRIADQAEFIKRQTANTVTIPFVSLLDKLKPTAPKESVKNTKDPEADPPADDKKAGGADTQQNLDIIKDYYQRAGDLEKSTP